MQGEGGNCGKELMRERRHPRWRWLRPSAALLGLALPLFAAAVTPAAGPTVEASQGGYGGYSWSPSSTEVGTGGAVAFKNPSGSVPHGVVWESGPESPSCAGVPIGEGRTSWSGSCTFSQPGTYRFYCYVHPTEMKGTVVVSPSGTVTTTPTVPQESGESPPSGAPAEALALPRRQHGESVRGSIGITAAGAGGTLEVDLLVPRAAVSGSGLHGMLRAGGRTLSRVASGRLRFAVPLNPVARRALRRRGRLPMTIKLIVRPTQGEAVRLTRKVVLDA